MILQDLAGIFLSSVSFFASDFFRLIWRNYKQHRTPTEDEIQSNSGRITGSLSSVIQQRAPDQRHSYGTIPCQHTLAQRPKFCKSFLNSLWTSTTILTAALPLGLFATLLLFLDLNTSNLCSEWIEHTNLHVEKKILRWRLIGDVIADFWLFFWFPSTMIFLFGWNEFKAHYLATLFVGYSAACLEIIYKLFLFIYDNDVWKEYFYHVAGNICFFLSILCSSYVIAVKIRKNGDFPVLPPKILVMATLSAQFIFAFILGLTGSYFVIPAFTKLHNQYWKALFAAIIPNLTIIPVAICRQLALLSNAFTTTTNNFILAYFVYGATVIVYRVMQADVDNLALFIGLSVLHGLVNVLGKATERIRYKVWARIFRALRRFRCCRQMVLQAHDSPYNQRLNADKEIQTMLYDYAAMILSQTYQTLFLITNFRLSIGDVLNKFLKRLTIGLGIDMFFNTFSILVRDYMYSSPVQKVWKQHWKVHLKANAVTTAMTIFYFSSLLLSVVHVNVTNQNHASKNFTYQNYTIKNCTVPIQF